MPEGLALPAIDVDQVFGSDLVADARNYERFFYVLWILAQVALVATLWIYARHGARFAKESSAGPVGTVGSNLPAVSVHALA